MRDRRVVVGVLALVLSLGLPGVSAGAAPDGGGSGSPGSERADAARAAQATEALNGVRALLGGDHAPGKSPDAHGPDGDGDDGHAHGAEGRELTPLLRDLRLGLDRLSGRDRAEAEALLTRPTGAPAFPGELQYAADALPTNDCVVAPTPGSNVCVHWATATVDAPPLTDSDSDGVPNQVELVRDTMNSVWDRLVVDGEYLAPLDDASSANPGPNGTFDVYLADIGEDSLYGYCTTDDPDLSTQYAVSAYCVLDDDYAAAQFPSNTPTGNLQVTAAHEFFHAVQYAYDWTEDFWLLEGTAAWVEDELYDAVNDNRQYLRTSPLSDPHLPLDFSSSSFYGQYGNWIFWRFLSERFPAEENTGLPVVVRDVIRELAGAPYSTQGLTRALNDRATTLPAVFSRFSVVNRRPGAFYSEGGAYSAAPTALRRTLGKGQRVPLAGTVRHLSSQTLRFTPGAGLTARTWKLRVKVDLPPKAYGYRAAVTSLRKNGSVRTVYLPVSAKGVGSKVVPFFRSQVKAVEVTIVNASVRYTCWQGTGLACEGSPKDDSRLSRLTVSTFR